MGLSDASLCLPQARQADGGTQLEHLGLLPLRHGDRMLKAALCLLSLRGVLLEEKIAADTIDLSLAIVFSRDHALPGLGQELQALIDEAQKDVTGEARIKLYKGNVMVVGRQSDDSLFDQAIATFEDDAGAYDQRDAEGFIKLNALRMRIAANKGRKLL